MNKTIQNIKKFLNRYNPKAFTSMLLYLSNDLIDFKVDVIEKFNQLKEMYKKDNNYLEDEFDTLQNKVDCVESDYNDYCVELEKKINNLESILLKMLDRWNTSDSTRDRRHEDMVKEVNSLSDLMYEVKGSVSRINGKN